MLTITLILFNKRTLITFTFSAINLFADLNNYYRKIGQRKANTNFSYGIEEQL